MFPLAQAFLRCTTREAIHAYNLSQCVYQITNLEEIMVEDLTKTSQQIYFDAETMTKISLSLNYRLNQ